MTKKWIIQSILLLSFACLCAGVFLLGRYVLQLPFNETNAALNKEGASFTLNFLIPGGVYLDEKATVGDVIRIKLKQAGSPLDRLLWTISGRIPDRYRYIANLVLFLFWSLCFLSFLRLFTLMGYGRALRVSLLCGGIVYYFMPDLSPGWYDDGIFVLSPVLIILLRWYLVRRKRAKEMRFR